MDPLISSSLISAGSSLLGKLFGGSKGPSPKDQADFQNVMIQNNMKSLMEGAKSLGIHPTVALGLNPGVGGMSFDVGARDRSTTGDMLNEMGQNLAGAVGRMQSADQKAVAAATTKLTLERGELENELLRTQIAQARATPVPGISNNNNQMIAGQADTGANYIATQLTKHENSEGKEAGTPSSWTTVQTKTGPMMVPSQDFQDRAEDIPLIGWEWLLRNKAPYIVEALRHVMPSKYEMSDWQRRNLQREPYGRR